MWPQRHDSQQMQEAKLESRGITVTTDHLYQTQRKGTFEKPEMSPN